MSEPRHIADLVQLVPPLNDDAYWERRDREVAEQRERQSAEELRRNASSRRAAYALAGFPQRALEAAEHADENTQAMRRVKSWSCDEQNILVLAGSAGTGKTVAATWWALRRRVPPMFVKATTFARSSRYDDDKRDTWLRADALVLDDLATEYADSKGNYLVDLDELIDTFYGDRRPLLITTNCDAKLFKERYGERVVDRIRECGDFYGVTGGSMRRKP